jgi:hypothetical protein
METEKRGQGVCPFCERGYPHEPAFPELSATGLNFFRNCQLLTRNFPEICGVVPNRSGLYGGDIVGAVAPTPPGEESRGH